MPEQTPRDFTGPYDAGYDCAVIGATKANSHFSWFATPESTAEWQRGKEAAEREVGKN